MLTAWRKLTKKEEKHVFPLGVVPVEQSMQKKYAKGVQYNMKLIIKGDRNTGKSVLLQRLSGNKFKEDYNPTQEIQVSNVNWNYQGHGDIVKTEVWDIVDKSKKKRTASGSLKIANESEVKEDDPMDSLTLDAEFIDVYKGTHGVFLIMDITKAWTWKYVQRELEKIPLHIPILILANFRDMGDHRVIEVDEIQAYIQHLERPAGSAEVYFTESSMKDGFGLQFVHSFLNMPFLMLQRESLMRQLEANTLEIDDTRESLSYDTSNDQQNYNLFHDMLEKANAPPELEPSVLSPKDITPAESPFPLQASTPTVTDPPSVTTPPTPSPPPTTKQVPVATVTPTIQQPTPQQQSHQQQQQQQNPPHNVSKFQAYKEKLFGAKNTPVKEAPTLDISDLDVVPIEDFNPGMLDNDFLDRGSSNTKVESKKTKKIESYVDSDEEDDNTNPMVAVYQDFDDDDVTTPPVVSHQQQNNTTVFADNSESDDDDFEDFSSDEDKESSSKGESHHNTSIMEQIKANKKKEKQTKSENVEVDEINVSTRELDINETDYANMESDGDDVDDVNNVVITEDVGNVVVEYSVPLKTPVIDVVDASPIVIQNSPDTDDESDEDGDQANPYVIAEDLDVEKDDDWMNKSKHVESESDKDDDGDDGDDTKVITAEITPDESSKQKDIQFNLDDLEAFMSDQMSKTTLPEVEDTQPEPEKPKKKKKKKVESSEAVNTEKKKKKKSKVKVNETEDTPPTKTKTKKSKKTTTATETEKGETTRKTSKSKSSKKKSPPVNDLDSFFAS